MHLTPTFLYKFIIEKHKFKSQRSTSLEIEKHKYDQYHHNVTEVQDAEEPNSSSVQAYQQDSYIFGGTQSCWNKTKHAEHKTIREILAQWFIIVVN